MSLTVWEIGSDKIKGIITELESIVGIDCKLITSSADKLELIEYVDIDIDIIYIESEDFQEISELIYFFREFNELLEYIPIIVSSSFDNYKILNTIGKTGIIDYVFPDADNEILLHTLKRCSNVTKTTNELRAENRNFRTELADNWERLEFEKKRSVELLMNILPEETSRELMIHGYAKPQFYKQVSVLFTDFKNFTKTCENMTAEEIVKELDFYFSKFDEISGRHFGEKIKTIGDAYMCAGGIPLRNKSNPVDMVLIGLEMQKFMKETNDIKNKTGKLLWHLRVGIHTGKLITGVIGKKKFAYDIWGDAVNTASRMESSGEADKVNISGITYFHVKKYFDCTYRGKIYAKNKGDVDMYFVDRIKPQYSEDAEGFIPNQKFLIELSHI